MSELVVSSRDALAEAIKKNARAFEGLNFDPTWNYTDDASNLADALLASGVVRALPEEETVADVLKSAHAAWYSSHVELHTFMARAVLALFTEGRE